MIEKCWRFGERNDSSSPVDPQKLYVPLARWLTHHEPVATLWPMLDLSRLPIESVPLGTE
jgi:hypothetical protein